MSYFNWDCSGSYQGKLRSCVRGGMGRLGLILCLAVASPRPAFAQTSFYLDPDWTGIQTGIATKPWSNLTASAWLAINSALSNNDVTVYFSACQAAADL